MFAGLALKISCIWDGRMLAELIPFTHHAYQNKNIYMARFRVACEMLITILCILHAVISRKACLCYCYRCCFNTSILEKRSSWISNWRRYPLRSLLGKPVYCASLTNTDIFLLVFFAYFRCVVIKWTQTLLIFIWNSTIFLHLPSFKPTLTMHLSA